MFIHLSCVATTTCIIFILPMWALGHPFTGFFVDKAFTIFNAVAMVLDT